MHRGLKSGPREPKRRTKNGHTKNLVFYEAKRVFYEAKRPQGGWREGPRLQIRLEGCEHKDRTRWLLNTSILKMRTPLECQAHFGLKGPPAANPLRRLRAEESHPLAGGGGLVVEPPAPP